MFRSRGQLVEFRFLQSLGVEMQIRNISLNKRMQPDAAKLRRGCEALCIAEIDHIEY